MPLLSPRHLLTHERDGWLLTANRLVAVLHNLVEAVDRQNQLLKESASINRALLGQLRSSRKRAAR